MSKPLTEEEVGIKAVRTAYETAFHRALDIVADSDPDNSKRNAQFLRQMREIVIAGMHRLGEPPEAVAAFCFGPSGR